MKIVFVLISTFCLVHSFSPEEDIEAAELSEEMARDQDTAVEFLETLNAVKEEARSCVAGGQVCKDDCDCCIDNNYCHCPFWGIFGANTCSCIFGNYQTCQERMRKCKRNRPQRCPGPSRRRYG